MNDFPSRSDIEHVIDPSFAMEAEERWWAIGIGQLGMIVRFHEDPPPGKPETLRWLGQVVKFCPKDEYLHPDVVFDLLRERGITGVEWRYG
jgi:hypothetical protein